MPEPHDGVRAQGHRPTSAHEEPQGWIFDVFRVDRQNAQLWRGAQPLPLHQKPFAMLCCLLTRAGQLVTKDTLLAIVWPEAVVSEAVLHVAMREVRQVLRDPARTPRLIETVHGLGYRFIAPVSRVLAPAPLYTLETPHRSSPAFVRSPPHFVGRDAELTQLAQWWRTACQGQQQVGLIAGEPGIGKTALVEAFVAQVATAEVCWVGHGQCLNHYGAGEAYLPLIEALGRLCRGPEGAVLVPLVHQYAPHWLVHVPALRRPGDQAHLASGVTPAQMHRELADLLEVLTATHPLVLILEDVHWSDRATLEWLAYVVRRHDLAHLLILATYRPVEIIVRAHPLRTLLADLRQQGPCAELVLDYLAAPAVAAYLTQRCAAMTLPASLPHVVHQRTSGHPLFLVALVDELVRQGLLATAGDRGGSGEALAVLSEVIPTSLRQYIEQHLEQLAEADQILLEAASVAGSTFAVAAVAIEAAPAPEALEARYTALARQGRFIRASGTETWPDGTVTACYAFRHAVYHEVVYARVSAGQRVRLHRQIGGRKEVGYGAQARDIAAELAVHFTRGRDPARAVQYCQYASEQALQRSAYQEAVTHLTQGLAQLAHWPETPARAQQELRMQTTLGTALMVTKGFGHPDVARTYGRAQVLCQQMGDTPALFPVLAGLWRSANGQAQHQHAWEIGAQLLLVAQQSGDPGLLLQAHHALWTTAYNTGALATAYQHVQDGVALYTPEQYHAQTARYGGHDPGVCGRSFAAKILWLLGYPDQAEQWNEAALALAQELGHAFTLGHTLQSATVLHQWQRDVHRAHERATATLRLGTAQGSQYLVARSTAMLGWAMAMLGRMEEGMVQLGQGLAAWHTMGTSHLRAEFLAMLAEAYGHAGRAAEGLVPLDEALAIIQTTGGQLRAAEYYGLKGELLWHAGQRPADAEACWQQALAIAQHQQAKSWELRVAMRLSRLWQQQGRRAEAYEVLAPVYGWFTEGFDTTDLREAKTLLVELGR